MVFRYFWFIKLDVQGTNKGKVKGVVYTLHLLTASPPHQWHFHRLDDTGLCKQFQTALLQALRFWLQVCSSWFPSIRWPLGQGRCSLYFLNSHNHCPYWGGYLTSLAWEPCLVTPSRMNIVFCVLYSLFFWVLEVFPEVCLQGLLLDRTALLLDTL